MVLKFIEKESSLPDGMDRQVLEKALYPGLLALATMFAREIKNKEERRVTGQLDAATRRAK